MARELVAASVSPDGETASTLRRVYARPSDGALVAMESRSRGFPPALAHFIRLRDQRCRTPPYCGSPIAEIDHAKPHRHEGPTSEANADGICVTHNRAKEADGWTYSVRMSGDIRVIDVITPTGARHRSTAPPAVGHRDPERSVVETKLLQILAAA